MSDVTDLSAYVQANFNEEDLINLTAFRDGTASAINTTRLEAACTSALLWFEQLNTTYQPGTYAIHKDAAANYVIYLLNTWNHQHDAAKQYKATADAMMEPYRDQRRVTPITTSEYAPSQYDSGRDEPPFDAKAFEDWID